MKDDDRLVTVWLLVLSTLLAGALAAAMLIYGPKLGLTVATGAFAAQLLSHLRR